MQITTVFLFLLLLMAVIYGIYAASHTVSGIKLLTVPGALMGCIGLSQLLLYTAAIFPVVLLLQFLAVTMDQTREPLSFTHSFVLELQSPAVQISDVYGQLPAASEINKLTAQVDINGSNLITTGLLGLAYLILWGLLYLILSNAKQVLRSLYDRTPFVKENPNRLRVIAACWISAWLVYSAYIFVMTIYLQSQLTTQGAQLRIIDIPFLTPLFVGGLLLVLSEVFRVGYELKEENALTV